MVFSRSIRITKEVTVRFPTLIVLLLIISLLFIGCSNNSGPRPKQAVQVAVQPGNPVPNAGDVAAPSLVRKIIYTCQIAVVVEDLMAAQQTLNTLIASIQPQGGYLANQELSGTSGSQRRGTWTIRVPLSEFDRFVSQVEKLGEIERNSRNAQDVTDAHTDLEGRLRNKQSSETRLLSHLEKSAQLKDTLELERELTRVRGEIEQLQGQMNLLNNKADLATVSLTLTERQEYIPPAPPVTASFPTLVSRTFIESWNNLVACAQGVALITVALAPWAVAAAIILLPIWLIRRNLRVFVNTGATH